MAQPAAPGQQRRPREPPLTLGRAPLRTLYYFGWSIASGVRDAAHFVATHPVTLFLALPALVYYCAAKALGYSPATTSLMEVRQVPWEAAGQLLGAVTAGRAHSGSLQQVLPQLIGSLRWQDKVVYLL